MTKAKCDVDVVSEVFDYDVSRELAGALDIGAKVSPTAMI
jgi:3-hydroxy-9,10-secoandrosta-1,3,5(10)-triene-9,17-dione monooxygenase